MNDPTNLEKIQSIQWGAIRLQSVMGFYGFCGSLGIMLAFLLGGWLFDHWSYRGPFILVAILSAGVAIWGLKVDRKIKQKGI